VLSKKRKYNRSHNFDQKQLDKFRPQAFVESWHPKMMRLLLLTAYILGCISLGRQTHAVTSNVTAADKGKGKGKDKDKDKGKDDDEKLKGLCATLEDVIFGHSVSCTCSVFLPLRGSYELTCTKEDICIGGDAVCGSIVWKGSYEFLNAAQIKTSLCVADIVWNLPPITKNPEDLCVEYSLNLRDELFPQGVATYLKKIPKSGRRQRLPDVNDCSVSIGSRECKSCTPCNNLGSVQFDCSNIRKGYRIDECIDFRPMIFSPIEVVDMW
jgi:hypothetical protein